MLGAMDLGIADHGVCASSVSATVVCEGLVAPVPVAAFTPALVGVRTLAAVYF